MLPCVWLKTDTATYLPTYLYTSLLTDKPPSLLLALPSRRRNLLLLRLLISETQCHPFFGVALSFKRLSTGRARTASCTCRLFLLSGLGGLGSGISGFRTTDAFGCFASDLQLNLKPSDHLRSSDTSSAEKYAEAVRVTNLYHGRSRPRAVSSTSRCSLRASVRLVMGCSACVSPTSTAAR